MAKKSLTDHSASAEKASEPFEFTESFVQNLAHQYGLKGREKALLQELNRAAFWCAQLQDFKPPKIPEQRDLLAHVNKLATELDEVLAKLGRHEKDLLNAFSKIYGWNATVLSVNQLKHTSRFAVDVLLANKGKHQPNPELDYLIAEFYEIYTQMTGDSRKYTYSNELKQYTGPAIEFIDACLQAMNIYKSNNTIGDKLKALLNSKG